jgi:spore maturation protein CgeB
LGKLGFEVVELRLKITTTMRIFYAAQTTPNEHDLLESRIWYNNLFLPLRDLGHEVISFDYNLSDSYKYLDPENERDKEFIRQNRPQLSEELLRQIKSLHRERPIDVFFSYFYSAHAEPSVIRDIRKLGIVTVNWYCNASYQFHLVKEIAPAYDYCLVPEKFRLDDYRKIGASPLYCQEAANPNIYKPYNIPITYNVTFVGQKYGNRPTYIRYLYNAGVDIRVWGPLWNQPMPQTPHWRRIARRIKYGLQGKAVPLASGLPVERSGEPLSDTELIQMYSRSKISLGFSTVAQLPTPGRKPVKQVRLRDFEATMSGAFYMVEAFDELTEFFEPDREIVMFNDAEELLQKVKFYLTHDSVREKIRRAGLLRARKEHTWQNRFTTAFRQMGLQ